MSDFEAFKRRLLSCSLCGTYYGYSDLVVACEQADASAFEAALAAVHAERPALWTDRCGGCAAPLAWEQITEHRRSWSAERAVEVPAPLCARCRRPISAVPDNHADSNDSNDVSSDGRTAKEMHAALMALIAVVEHRHPGGDPQ
jgi:hypothetical protein